MSALSQINLTSCRLSRYRGLLIEVPYKRKFAVAMSFELMQHADGKWQLRILKVHQFKRVIIGLSIAVITGAVGIAISGKYLGNSSSVPSAYEQQRLALDHAYCAGFYVVMRSSVRKENPDYAELEKTYRTEVERHVQTGLSLSLEKDGFQSRVESAVSEIGQEIVVAAAEKEKVVSLVENQMRECAATLFQTVEFLKKAPKIRSSDGR